MAKLKILFLCTGNSCRSQMAEGWCRWYHKNTIEAYSAGTEPHGLNPAAVRVMREAGVDISGHKSKNIESLAGMSFDIVITVCNSARQQCPVFPGQFTGKMKTIHKSFDDPPAIAKTAVDPDASYRRVRDEIKEFVKNLPTMMITQKVLQIF